MKQRIISALIFGTIILIMVFASQYTFLFLLLAICFLSHQEYYRIFSNKDGGAILYSGAACLITAFILWFIHLSPELLKWKVQVLSVLMALSIAIILYAFLRLTGTTTKSSLGATGLVRGLVYLIPPLILFSYIGHLFGEYLPKTILFLFLLVWINDSAAYFVGSQIGKNKLSPKISPNKTWEGFIGGIIFTVILGFLVAPILTPLRSVDGLYMGALTSIFGPMGDLFESQFKRMAGLKDSGQIIPGHGGILDRFDALFFVVPVCAIYLTYFK